MQFISHVRWLNWVQISYGTIALWVLLKSLNLIEMECGAFENTSSLIRLPSSAVVRVFFWRVGKYAGEMQVKRRFTYSRVGRRSSRSRRRSNTTGAVQGQQRNSRSLDLHHCASGNFISMLARLRGSVAQESASHFDRQNGSQTAPSRGTPRPCIINQPLME